jgi:alkyl hydroperoxide reductase subunit AhpC
LPSTVERLHRELAPRGLSVVAVNIQESQSTVAAWAREKKVTIPILLDTDGEVTRQYSVIATPTSFLIDREGRLLGRIVGPRDWGSPAGKALIAGLLTAPPGR